MPYQDKHNMFHYPGMTDAEVFRISAIESSTVAPCTIHFHPYSDYGCDAGLKHRSEVANQYAGLPNHERYIKGTLSEKS